MAPEHHAAAGHLFAENSQSHLLELPPELRNKIYEYALTADDTPRNRELHTPCRPGLLQVCCQLWTETRRFYSWFNEFHIIVTVNNTDEARLRTAAVTDEVREGRIQLHLVQGLGSDSVPVSQRQGEQRGS